MGTWGTALFSDDTACDVRDEYIDHLGDGLTGAQATERLLSKWASSLNDQDEAPAFWLALAATQWKYGRLESRVLQNALDVIDNGSDLLKWKSSPDYRKRQAVLEKLRATLVSPQAPEKHVPKRFRDARRLHGGRHREQVQALVLAQHAHQRSLHLLHRHRDGVILVL